MLAPYFRCSLIGNGVSSPFKFPGRLVRYYSQTSVAHCQGRAVTNDPNKQLLRKRRLPCLLHYRLLR